MSETSTGERICTQCGECYPPYQFYANKICKRCSNENVGRYNQARATGLRNKLLSKQGGVCAICKRGRHLGHRMQLDHDHLTGQPRGLLCSRCNVALGRFLDSISILESAIQYLQDYGKKPSDPAATPLEKLKARMEQPGYEPNDFSLTEEQWLSLCDNDPEVVRRAKCELALNLAEELGA